MLAVVQPLCDLRPPRDLCPQRRDLGRRRPRLLRRPRRQGLVLVPELTQVPERVDDRIQRGLLRVSRLKSTYWASQQLVGRAFVRLL